MRLFSLWRKGLLNGLIARRHKLTGTVQIRLWVKGQHGHKKDFYTNADKSHWLKFRKTKYLKTERIPKTLLKTKP